MNINIKNGIHNRFDDLIKPEEIETKHILTSEENFKNLVIYFTKSYVNCKSIK